MEPSLRVLSHLVGCKLSLGDVQLPSLLSSCEPVLWLMQLQAVA